MEPIHGTCAALPVLARCSVGKDGLLLLLCSLGLGVLIDHDRVLLDQ